MGDQKAKPCGCGEPASQAVINEAIRIWKKLPKTRATGEPYQPKLDENGDPDQTVKCTDNPEVTDISVWAPYFLAYGDWEGDAIAEQNSRSIKDIRGAALRSCRGIVV